MPPVSDLPPKSGINLLYLEQTSVDIFVEFVKLDTTKLSVIICDEHSGKTIMANDRLSDEIFYFNLDYASLWLDFNSLYKVSMATRRNLR